MSLLIIGNDKLAVQSVNRTSPPIITYFHSITKEVLLDVAGAIDDRTIEVVDATGFVAGSYITIFNIAANRFYTGVQIGAPAANVISLDTPLDFAYPSGSFVTSGNKEMKVNGASTSVLYGIRNTTEVIGSTFDITRIIFTCLCSSAADLSLFGNITALVSGLVIRKKDGMYRNILNVKTNQELANLMYDFTIYAASNPVQGQDGFVGRLTFAGDNKMGVAIRLAPGEDLQCIIQDDLTGLTSLQIIVEGHLVEDYVPTAYAE